MLLLPASLLLLIATYPDPSRALEIPWRWPSALLRRHAGQREATAWRQGRGPYVQANSGFHSLRKMSLDEGEMFFPEYWVLNAGKVPLQREPIPPEDGESAASYDELLERANATVSTAQAAFALHEIIVPKLQLPLPNALRLPRALSALSKREFTCPDGTSACNGIDRPNSCCPSGLGCQLINDSGSGDVGCCVQGEKCGQDVGRCASDQQSCPRSQGGGCCVAGYSCAGVGCEAGSTAFVVINPTVTASPPSTGSSSGSSVAVSTAASTSISSSATTVMSSSSTERVAAPVAPVRPTSGTVSTTETSTGPTTTFTPTSCPTGFYACNAHYLGGCCRVGRDCASTSCPAPPSSFAFSSNGVEIGAAPPEPTRLGEDRCALGWFRCDGGGGGGCCPSGYACGESCTATGVNIGGGVTGTAKVAKDNAGATLIKDNGIWRLAGSGMSIAFVALLLSR